MSGLPCSCLSKVAKDNSLRMTALKMLKLIKTTKPSKFVFSYHSDIAGMVYSCSTNKRFDWESKPFLGDNHDFRKGFCSRRIQTQIPHLAILRIWPDKQTDKFFRFVRKLKESQVNNCVTFQTSVIKPGTK